MTNIVYIFRQYASPPTLPGSVRHHLFAKTLVHFGHQAYIFPSNYHHMLMRHIYTFKEPYILKCCEKVNYVWLPGIKYYNNGIKRLRGMIQYARLSYRTSVDLYQKMGIKPKLVIGSVAHSFGALSAFFIAKRFGANFWMDIGDLWPEGLIKAGTLTPRHPLTYLFRWISDFLYRKAELILVLNTSAFNYFIDKGFDANKVVHFPSGIFFQSPVPDDAFKDKEIFRVVYAGSMSALYPLEEAIKAVSRFSDYKQKKVILEIVGEGPDKNKLSELAKRICPENVFFEGIVAKSHLAAIYRRADALLVIEKDVGYGFPNKLIDYLSTTKPIILAAENGYGLSETMAIKTQPVEQDIVRALETLLQMRPSDRKQMGMNAFNHGLHKYDIQSNFRNLLLKRI